MDKFIAQGLIIGPTGSQVHISGPTTISTLGDLINKLMTFLMPLAAVILFFILMWGGYDYLMSSGEAEKLQSGKNKITAGLIGFILLVLSYFFAKFFGSIFGLGGGLF